MRKAIIGTRGSQLALWQSNWVADRLREAHPGLTVELTVIRTSGDRFAETAIAALGGKGAFTKEIQDALLERKVDVAVHSLKDLPTWPVDGLRVGAYPPRVDPRDAWLSRDGRRFLDLAAGDSVATSSLRRQAQIRHRFPGVAVEPMRGNIDTRLRKLREGEVTGMILAMAGLTRLGLAGHVTEAIPPGVMIPSPGQGCLAVEGRDDDATRELLAPLDDAPTRTAVAAERALLAALEGSCLVPIGGFAVLEGNEVVLDGMVADPDGGEFVRQTARGPRDDPESLGRSLAAGLRDAGAAEILARLEARER